MNPSPEPRVSRPLKELTALVREDLVAARKAEAPHYAVAGEKLREAKAHFELNSYGLPFGFHESPGFCEWAARMFDCSQYQVKLWMKYAVEVNGGKPFAFQAEVKAPEATAPKRPPRPAPKWHGPRGQGPVQEIRNQINFPRLIEEQEAREKEAKLQKKLKAQLIDAGRKAMAIKLHPDRGGSTADMTRLNQVCDAMKKGYI
jgi:hypothetical protein